MAKKLEKIVSSPWFVLGVLFFIGNLVYLPKLMSFGFYKDDWYLMYDAQIKGTDFFRTIFAIDRPARAPLQSLLYSLFGESLIFYHISALFFRTFGAWMFWFIMRFVLPSKDRMNLIAAILFLIYPGFLSQPNAVDFQAHIVSLSMALASIAISIAAVRSEQKILKYLGILAAVVLAWVYLGLMEYFIGLEVYRFLMIGWVLWRKDVTLLREKVRNGVALSIPLLAGSVGFLLWRLFLFEGGRKATDITAQLNAFFTSPIQVGVKWVIQLGQDAFNVIVGAWVIPFTTLVFDLRLRDTLQAVGIGSAIVVIVYFLIKYSEEDSDYDYRLMVLGFVAVLGGIFPVVLANRSINFTDYSRYTLPAMAGGILFLVGILSLIKHRNMQTILVLILCVSAGMTHFGNAILYSEETAATRNFWWQVAWRVPGFDPTTTLLADYPASAIQEDYFIWGPANLIYSREKQSGADVVVPINALVLNQENILKVLVGKGAVSQVRRGNVTSADLNNVLVLTQSAANACVRVLDGEVPELSEGDRPEIALVATASKTSTIALKDLKEDIVPNAFFGIEPQHGWCFTYQKASLARQEGDWQKVVDLYEKSLGDGYYPSDKVEWLPLLQAYATLGETEKLKPYVSILAESPYIQKQACTLLVNAAKDPSDKEWIATAFCN